MSMDLDGDRFRAERSIKNLLFASAVGGRESHIDFFRNSTRGCSVSETSSRC